MNLLNFVHLLTPVASGLMDLTGHNVIPAHTLGAPTVCLVHRMRRGVHSLSELSRWAVGIFCWWHLKVQRGQERLNHGGFRRTMKRPLVCWARVLGQPSHPGRDGGPHPARSRLCVCSSLSGAVSESPFLARAYSRETLKSCQ